MASQKDVILSLLRERGKAGVSAHEAVYSQGITRMAAIVHSLKGEGYAIVTVDDGDTGDGRRKLARYVLIPAQPLQGQAKLWD